MQAGSREHFGIIFLEQNKFDGKLDMNQYLLLNTHRRNLVSIKCHQHSDNIQLLQI